MTDETNSRLHATVTGSSAGCKFPLFCFRASSRSLNLRGWVRNRWNGSVEVTAEGSRQNLELLLLALRDGPPMASVTDVDFEWLSYTGEFVGFQVRKTV